MGLVHASPAAAHLNEQEGSNWSLLTDVASREEEEEEGERGRNSIESVKEREEEGERVSQIRKDGGKEGRKEGGERSHRRSTVCLGWARM